MIYQVMPDLTDDEYNELKADIAQRGVMVPVELDEYGNILDGHHRVRACNELGIMDYPITIRSGMTEEEKMFHARKLNMARRHLTQEQRRELIRAQLIETPEKSDRQIAAGLGVSHHTVGTQREELETRGQIAHVSETFDTLGRKQPRKNEMEEGGELLHCNTSIGADGKERPRQVKRSEADQVPFGDINTIQGEKFYHLTSTAELQHEELDNEHQIQLEDLGCETISIHNGEKEVPVQPEIKQKEPETRSDIIKRIRESESDNPVVDATEVFNTKGGRLSKLNNEVKEANIYIKINDTLNTVYNLFHNAPLDEYARIYTKHLEGVATKEENIIVLQEKIDLLKDFQDAIIRYKPGRIVVYENQ